MQFLEIWLALSYRANVPGILAFVTTAGDHTQHVAHTSSALRALSQFATTFHMPNQEIVATIPDPLLIEQMDEQQHTAK